jgi:carbon-monoxide dehydrogenase small subunit
MAGKQEIHLRINGETYDLDVVPGRLLVDCLRYDLGLTGTKEGCGIGVCGACTVLIDGRMASSCLLLAIMADGTEVTTIEGLAREGRLDPLQQAFIDYGGYQCGICTPGQIMAARALLNQTSSPSEQEIKEWMMGNLCRCTGYYKIVESILAAARVEGEDREAVVDTRSAAARHQETS